MLESIQEPLDEVALFVLGLAVPPLDGAGFERRDDDFRFAFAENIQKGIRIVRLIGNDSLGLVICEDFLGSDQIVLLAGTESQFERLSLGVAGDVQLGAETASRATERFVPFF
jgi:hypothetical protein